jgi:hypothetical protein
MELWYFILARRREKIQFTFAILLVHDAKF